ncbi:MAG TPA: hypothetical protein VGM69_26175 [Chloroflexota bacterium]|jgi:hypothetical protein
MAEADLERWRLVVQAVAALGGLSALATLVWTVRRNRRPSLGLTLFSSTGERERWGDPYTGDWTYFYHVKVKNRRNVPARSVGVRLTKVNKARRDEPLADEELPAPVRLTWARREREPDPSSLDIAEGGTASCNLGYMIGTEGYFKLNVALEPVPPRFVLLERERMRVEAVAENAPSNRLVVEISWDGVWSDEPGEMAKHLLVAARR